MNSQEYDQIEEAANRLQHEICEYEKYEKREDDQREFAKACDELKAELKKTWMYKTIIRLLDWLAEKV